MRLSLKTFVRAAAEDRSVTNVELMPPLIARALARISVHLTLCSVEPDVSARGGCRAYLASRTRRDNSTGRDATVTARRAAQRGSFDRASSELIRMF
jgi:hypothetical protein